jgi:hypothetical protein
LGIVDIHGTQGFRAQLRLDLLTFGGPWEYSLAPEGTPIRLNTIFRAGEGGGTVEVAGEVYRIPDDENANLRMFVAAGEIPMPPFGADPVRLSAPFTVGGTRVRSFVATPSAVYDLSGKGIITLDLEPVDDLGMRITRMEYDFQPIPEPASFLLLGTGIAALGARYRRRISAR